VGEKRDDQERCCERETEAEGATLGLKPAVALLVVVEVTEAVEKETSRLKELGDDGMVPKDEVVDEAYDEGTLPQDAVSPRVHAGRATYDAMLAAVGVIEAQEEQSEAGEEAEDQSPTSTSQSPLLLEDESGKEDESGNEDDAAKNCKELTLEYRDSNNFEGRVVAFRPRKRAKYSHKRMACMVWRFHEVTLGSC